MELNKKMGDANLSVFWTSRSSQLPKAFTVAVPARQAEKLESLRATIDQAIEEGWGFQEFFKRCSRGGTE